MSEALHDLGANAVPALLGGDTKLYREKITISPTFYPPGPPTASHKFKGLTRQ
jgi:hypothetical protein